MKTDGQEKENVISAAPRPMHGVRAPFKKPTFNPPLMNQQQMKAKPTILNKSQIQSHVKPIHPTTAQNTTTAVITQAISQKYRVVYIPFEDFAKKKKIRKWQDGFLELSANGLTTLTSEEGKKVWSGKARQVGGQGSSNIDRAAFSSKLSSRQGSKNKDRNKEEEEEEGEGTLRFELGSILAEAEGKALDEVHPSLTSSRSQPPHLASNPPPQPLAKVSQSLASISQPSAAGPSVIRGPQSSSSRPLHDPSASGAIILRGTTDSQPGSSASTPVVIDPHLARKLRPHQIEGVQFMHSREGVLLADEMGLGKTLQVITLLWTLLKQGPRGRPEIEKCVVVCPSSLVHNWGREVKKWLGNERLQALMIVQGSPDNSQIINDFRTIRNNPSRFGLLIISYESARKYSGEIGAGSCDVLICDEAHRLKSGEGKTMDALNALQGKRKILLTGTPVQNNLSEFAALLEFCSPGLFGSSSFKKMFGEQISKGRDGGANEDERAASEDRSLELAKIISNIVLRRTAEILTKHLPPLRQFVVFVRPSELQVDMYKKALYESERSLALIKVLQKISTSPALSSESTSPLQGTSESRSLENSGKMQLLSILLEQMVKSGQKCVVVSTSTATLDLVDSSICGPLGMISVRIDGSVSVNLRQDIVDGFNLRGQGQVMLLSTRAGGAGLNLIGANNLILVDSDWNPAHDLQAMARIWRDGQKKPCFVFRLLTAGTIEERVYQRQLMKSDLATATIDLKASKGGRIETVGLHHEDLKELFAIEPPASNAHGCDTMNLLAKSTASESPLEWILDGSIHPALTLGVKASIICALGEFVKGIENVVINEHEEEEDEEEGLMEEEQVTVHVDRSKAISIVIDPPGPLPAAASRKRLHQTIEAINIEPEVTLDDLED